MSNKIGLTKKPPATFEPSDDIVRDDEALFAIGVLDAEGLQEKYDDLVRAAEQCMRQRNALWLRLSVLDGPGAAAVVGVDEVERSCAAIGPLFVAPPDPWALPPGWSWYLDEDAEWYARDTAGVGVYWDPDDGPSGSTLALDQDSAVVGAPDEVHELVRRRNLAESPYESLAAIVDATAYEVDGPVRHALLRLAVRLRGVR